MLAGSRYLARLAFPTRSARRCRGTGLPVRALQGSRHHARDDRRGSRAGLACDLIRVPRATVRAAGPRIEQQSAGGLAVTALSTEQKSADHRAAPRRFVQRASLEAVDFGEMASAPPRSAGLNATLMLLGWSARASACWTAASRPAYATASTATPTPRSMPTSVDAGRRSSKPTRRARSDACFGRRRSWQSRAAKTAAHLRSATEPQESQPTSKALRDLLTQDGCVGRGSAIGRSRITGFALTLSAGMTPERGATDGCTPVRLPRTAQSANAVMLHRASTRIVRV